MLKSRDGHHFPPTRSWLESVDAPGIDLTTFASEPGTGAQRSSVIKLIFLITAMRAAINLSVIKENPRSR
jgi:hypothetical protein